MRGVFCCAAAALAVLAATAGGASADRGGVKHVTVIHPVPAAGATFDARSIGFALRNAGAFHVSDTATARQARELVTLASASAPRSLVYDLQLPSGVTAMQLGPRAVAFVRNKLQVATFSAPAMVDASGAISRAIEVTLHGNTIHVTPSGAWLASADYPVTIDPDVLTLQGAAQDTYIESGSPDGYFAGDPQLLVGDDGTQAIRGLLNFDIDMYVPSGATIDSAQLALNLESATTGASTNVTVAGTTDRWSDVTWLNYDYDWQTGLWLPWTNPGGDVDPVGAATASIDPTPGLKTWDLTSLVQREVSGLAPSNGFLLQQQGETTSQVLAFTSSYTWTSNPMPTLTITWETPSTSGPAVSLPGGNSVGFGAGLVGTPRPTQEVDVQNSGDAPLNVSSLAITGPNAADFGISGSTCTGDIQPGAICAITLSATPSVAGNESATLTIGDNAPNSPQSVALMVTGQAPAPSVVITSGNPVDFGSQIVGTTSAPQEVDIANQGTAPLAVDSLALSGPNAGDFRITGTTCTGTQVQPGSSCAVTVTATPSVLGGEKAALVLTDNATDSPQTVTLEVVGDSPGQITISPVDGIDFGNVRVGKTSGTKYATVKSTGTAPVALGSVALGGADAADFVIVSNSCSGASLAPGASCTVGVRARPLAKASRDATLDVADNGANGGSSLPLTVWGT
jgi:hypothetical protein